MRRAGLFGGSLLVAAFLISGGPALAQEVQFDTKALEPGATNPAPVKRKGKKAAAPDAQQQPAQGTQGAKTGPNRQFGELEGWSPGKAPPNPKDKYDADPNASSSSGKPAVSVTPSGNMNVGLPF